MLSACRFSNNFSVQGGGLYCAESEPILIACVFRENEASSGGGLEATDYSSASLQACRFENNLASMRGGGVFAGFSALEAEDCVFDGNTALDGGALACSQCPTVTVARCTLHGNGAARGGGIAGGYASVLAMDRTIVAFGTEGEAVYTTHGEMECTLTCCDLFGNSGGDWVGSIADQYGVAGNISSDPLFCDAGAGNFDIDTGSPCAPFSPSNPECDLVGAGDVGCAPSGTPERESPCAPRVGLVAAAPNPTRGRLHLTYTLPDSGRPAHLRLEILDAQGRKVRALLDGTGSAGTRGVTWDGCDDRGRPAPSGFYFGRLSWETGSHSRGVLLIR